MSFTCNTLEVSHAYYIILVTAEAIPKEVCLGDNTLFDDDAHVRILGDINRGDTVDVYDAISLVQTSASRSRVSRRAINDDGLTNVLDAILLTVNCS